MKEKIRKTVFFIKIYISFLYKTKMISLAQGN